jgi:hypothetical protein
LSECEKHAGQDTIVPCLDCGRSFCRVCDPPRGAGQYCPVCYKEQVDRLAGKEGETGRRGLLRRTTDWAGQGRSTGVEKEPGSAGRLRAGVVAPFAWIGRTATAAGRKIEAAALFLGRLPKRFAIATAAGARRIVRETREHFPIGLAPREILEGDPPLREAWRKLLAFTVAGLVLLTILVWLSGVRNPGFSIAVAVLVAAGVVWSLGTEYGPKVAVFAAGCAIVSLIFGELVVQLLYRAGIIKKLDLQKAALVTLDKPSMFYTAFIFKMSVERLLPAAAAAFLVGWWPLRRRLSWPSFRIGAPNGHTREESKAQAAASERPQVHESRSAVPGAARSLEDS